MKDVVLSEFIEYPLLFISFILRFLSSLGFAPKFLLNAIQDKILDDNISLALLANISVVGAKFLPRLKLSKILFETSLSCLKTNPTTNL